MQYVHVYILSQNSIPSRLPCNIEQRFYVLYITQGPTEVLVGDPFKYGKVCTGSRGFIL